MHANENVIGAWALGLVDAVLAGYARVGLAEREVAALVLVESHPGAGADWLQGRLGLTQSGTVRLIDRLAAAGLVRRGPGGGRRGVPLTLTAAGQGALESAVAERAAAVSGAMTGLSETERGELARLAGTALAGTGRDRTRADTACRLCDWPACADPCPVDASVPIAT